MWFSSFNKDLNRHYVIFARRNYKSSHYGIFARKTYEPSQHTTPSKLDTYNWYKSSKLSQLTYLIYSQPIQCGLRNPNPIGILKKS